MAKEKTKSVPPNVLSAADMKVTLTRPTNYVPENPAEDPGEPMMDMIVDGQIRSVKVASKLYWLGRGGQELDKAGEVIQSTVEVDPKKLSKPDLETMELSRDESMIPEDQMDQIFGDEE